MRNIKNGLNSYLFFNLVENLILRGIMKYFSLKLIFKEIQWFAVFGGGDQ